MKDIYLNPETSNNCFDKNKKTQENKYNSLSFSWLYKAWEKFVHTLIHSEELRVWQRRDRQGNTYWEVYDPQTGKYFSSGSEADILAWIEQRYKTIRFS